MSKRKIEYKSENERPKKKQRRELETRAAKHLSKLSSFELKKIADGPIVTSHPPIWSIIYDQGIMHWNTQEGQYKFVSNEPFFEVHGDHFYVIPLLYMNCVLVFVYEDNPYFIMIDINGKTLWKQPTVDSYKFDQKSNVGNLVVAYQGESVVFFYLAKLVLKSSASGRFKRQKSRFVPCPIATLRYIQKIKTTKK